MNLGLTQTQIELRDSARDFVRGAFPDAALIELQNRETGYSPELWAAVARPGWFGLLVPEQYGGADLPAADAAVVFEEFGRGPLPLLVFTSAVLGPLVLRALASAEQAQQWLPALAQGSVRLSPAITEADYGWDAAHIRATLRRDDNGYMLNGTKLFVPDAAGASHFLVPAVLDGEVVFAMVDATARGVAPRRLAGFTDWQSEVQFTDVELLPERLLASSGGPSGAWGAFDSALETAIPIMTSYQVGSCQAVFEMSVAYSSSRVQFGRPIGQFQRVQDHIIGLVNHLDAARWTTYEALSKLDKHAPARAAVHLAKALAAEAHWEVCNAAHEIHAGLGSDTQFGLAKHTYLSRSLYAFLGDPTWHRQQLAKVLGW
jgi:alkylation response protein AidB-like acyl-CoA dehydrogenase